MASAGGPFQSGHGPVERAGVLNFVGRERANLAGGNLGQRGGRSVEKRSSRRREALASFAGNSMSLLTSAATRS